MRHDKANDPKATHSEPGCEHPLNLAISPSDSAPTQWQTYSSNQDARSEYSAGAELNALAIGDRERENQK
jgi:hypothetical protein